MILNHFRTTCIKTSSTQNDWQTANWLSIYAMCKSFKTTIATSARLVDSCLHVLYMLHRHIFHTFITWTVYAEKSILLCNQNHLIGEVVLKVQHYIFALTFVTFASAFQSIGFLYNITYITASIDRKIFWFQI